MVPSSDRTLLDYWRVLVRRKWIIIVAILLAIIGALVMSFLQRPIYRADAQMLVEPRSSGAVFQQDPTLNVQSLDRAIRTEVEVLEGQQVRARVQRDLGLPSLPPQVKGTPVGSTDVVSVSVRSRDPKAAATLADAYIDAYASTRREQAIDSFDAAGRELQAKIDELQQQIDAAGAQQSSALVAQQATFKNRLDQLQIDTALTTGGASVVKSADVPSDPVEPKPLRAALLASVVGLLLGLGAAFLIDYLDDSIRTNDDLEALTDQPVLAVVPVEPPPDERPIALSEPHEAAVEIYRGLRTNVQFLGLDARLRIIQVTSSLPSEGKTTTSANLAVVLAQAGMRVALVDADLRKPRVHELFGVPPVPGFTELVLGEAIEMALHHVAPDLDVITAGQVPPNPSEMMSNERLPALLRKISDRYDYVIVDAPPVLPVSDSVALTRSVDGVLLVVQANRVSKREVNETLSRLARVDAPVFGLVLNRARRGDGDAGAYGYGYGYGYGTPPAEDRTPVAVTATEAEAETSDQTVAR